VVLYEAERLQEGQEDVIEDLRQERLHKGRIEAIYKGQDPDALGVLTEALPPTSSTISRWPACCTSTFATFSMSPRRASL
jgi:hypothetical protein